MPTAWSQSLPHPHYLSLSSLSTTNYTFHVTLSAFLYSRDMGRHKHEPFPHLSPSLSLSLSLPLHTALGAMIFGRRLGCIPTKNNAEAADNSTLSIHEFVDCVQNIFIESANMQLMPPKLAYRLKLPVWRRFEKAAGRALELGKMLMMEIKNKTNNLST